MKVIRNKNNFTVKLKILKTKKMYLAVAFTLKRTNMNNKTTYGIISLPL